MIAMNANAEFDKLLYDEDGTPVLLPDGTQATWADLMAGVAREAKKRGKSLHIKESATGELLYGLEEK